MTASSIAPLANTVAISSISIYQRYISPHKGFSCPHRLLHGGDSCSEYTKRMLTTQNLTTALQLSLQRFKNCTAASHTLKTAHANASSGCIVIPCCIPI
ncbi:MAG: membrane protein insertion efficiency factor YidD [Nostocaceae cyanobacterium]|nr:membrane protein insertion efficiency factor YidD [Nostocaceae cyanobacterium]